MEHTPEIYGVILASGRSSRMGCNKLLLPYSGKSMAECVLNKTLAAKLKQIHVVLPKQNEELVRIFQGYPLCKIILNPVPALGMGHSLSLAIKSLPKTADAVIILLGDQPLIQAEDIFNMKKEFEEKSYSIIRTKYREGRVGHPVLFSKRLFSHLLALQGDTGGKEVIGKYSDQVHILQSLNRFPNDIDTPQDYLQLLNSGREED